jgi:hypothetical protein
LEVRQVGGKKSAVAGGGASANDNPGGSSAPETRRRTRILGLVMALIAIGGVALAGWAIWALMSRETQPTPDRAELEALDTKLTVVRETIAPIAVAFTSQGTTTPIDVTAYGARIERARRTVTSVNDVRLTSPEAIEVRDMIITGGSQVLDGMDEALTALVSDEASGAEQASSIVEEGLTTLEDAKTRLDELLGDRSRT